VRIQGLKAHEIFLVLICLGCGAVYGLFSMAFFFDERGHAWDAGTFIRLILLWPATATMYIELLIQHAGGTAFDPFPLTVAFGGAGGLLIASILILASRRG